MPNIIPIEFPMEFFSTHHLKFGHCVLTQQKKLKAIKNQTILIFRLDRLEAT